MSTPGSIGPLARQRKASTPITTLRESA